MSKIRVNPGEVVMWTVVAFIVGVASGILMGGWWPV